MEISVVVGAEREVERSINDGIWSVYYFLLIVCIMIMWKPSENTSAYAYHFQVATDIQEVWGEETEVRRRTTRSTDCRMRSCWIPRRREKSK